MNPSFLFSSPSGRSWAVLLTALLTTARLLGLESTTNQTFQVSSGGRLVMDVDRGSIEITATDAPTVVITAIREVKRASDPTAQELLDRHQLAFTQEGDTVTVKARMTKRSFGSWLGPNLSVRYQVSVPKQFNLKLDTAGGSIRIPDLTGKIELGTAGGSISVGHVEGPVKADTAGGSITVLGATGAVAVDTAGGSIELGEMGAAVQAGTAGGSIRIKSAVGPVKADTSGGSIQLGDMQGPVHAETSGGAISARFPQSPGGEVSLDTSGGSISVYLIEEANFQLDAKCSGGRVTSDLTVATTGKPSRSEMQGQVGSGGPKVVLRTSGGGIALKKLVAAN